VDTEVMLGSLSGTRLSITNDPQQADIFVINTCSFIKTARSESDDAIKNALLWKKQKKHRMVLVAGCMPQRYAEEINTQYPEVDRFISLDEVSSLGSIISEISQSDYSDKGFSPQGSSEFLYDHNTPRLLTTPASYAYMKIAEGCNHSCSFCAIPAIRGKQRSRTIDSLITEAASLLDNGTGELILVAQDSSGFGTDLNKGNKLQDLLQALDKLPVKDPYWLRLLYLYPTMVTDELIEVIAESEHLVKYIDMPLQHISDKVLQRMRRGISKERTLKLLETFREKIPSAVMRTTLLVGHPGETDEEFEELLQFVQKQRFNRLGVFPYSHEENTFAYQYKDFADSATVEARIAKLMQVQQEISLDLNKNLIGKTVQVIIDEVSPDEHGNICGRTAGDAPDVDNLVHFPWDECAAEDVFANVKITEADIYDLYGHIVSS